MRNVCIITHHPFWLEPLGCGSLIRARWDLLKEISDNLYVMFITNSEIKCPLSGGMTLQTNSLSANAINAVRGFIADKQVTTAYFSYDQFGVIADQLSCKKVVEIHDVLHLRQKKFEEFGYEAPYRINKDAELESLRRYDFVACLNLMEVDYLHRNSVANAIYLPPNIPFAQVSKNTEILSAGLIASMAKPNVDGIHRAINYLENLPHVVLAGPICQDEKIKNIQRGNVTKLGVIGDVKDFYSKIDVALSPLRFGGGLKIKVFEALANGRPLIATEHSIEGFPLGIEKIVTIENDFSKWNSELLEKTSLISSEAIEAYFEENFSRAICEKILKNLT